MTDLEGIAKHLLAQNWPESAIHDQLKEEYLTFKNLPIEVIEELITAVLTESKESLAATQNLQSGIVSTVLEIPVANVTMGEHGVGCRGQGDFFVHSLLAQLSKTSIIPLVSPESLDDTGAVEYQCSDTENKLIILTKMEGMHSRLERLSLFSGIPCY